VQRARLVEPVVGGAVAGPARHLGVERGVQVDRVAVGQPPFAPRCAGQRAGKAPPDLAHQRCMPPAHVGQCLQVVANHRALVHRHPVAAVGLQLRIPFVVPGGAGIRVARGAARPGGAAALGGQRGRFGNQPVSRRGTGVFGVCQRHAASPGRRCGTGCRRRAARPTGCRAALARWPGSGRAGRAHGRLDAQQRRRRPLRVAGPLRQQPLVPAQRQLQCGRSIGRWRARRLAGRQPVR
jgi:hypothetical protein